MTRQKFPDVKEQGHFSRNIGTCQVMTEQSFEFSDKFAADLFVAWLWKNDNVAEYGHPTYTDCFHTLESDKWTVKFYSNSPFVEGFAAGIAHYHNWQESNRTK